MRGLSVLRIIYGLYVTERDRFIGYFETFEEASAFAKKFYPYTDAHVEPYIVFTFKETEE